jgi:hypothetical protein
VVKFSRRDLSAESILSCRSLPIYHVQHFEIQMVCVTLKYSFSNHSNYLQADSQDVQQLPSETIEFAHRMFEAARTGDSALLLSAVDSGLPVNLTNDKGFIPAL